MKKIVTAAVAALCFNAAAGRAAAAPDLSFAGLQEIGRKGVPAAAVAMEFPVPMRTAQAENLLPLTAVGINSELVVSNDFLIPPDLYQIYVQDGALAVTAYRTRSFCRFSVIGSPARRVLKKGARIKIQGVPHTNAYIEELDVQISMDYLQFSDSNFYALYCVGENPVPNGSYLGAPKFISSVTIGEMKSLLKGFFEFRNGPAQ